MHCMLFLFSLLHLFFCFNTILEVVKYKIDIKNKQINCVGMFKDKNQAVKHPADILPKKVGETLPPQSSQMGYGIYHFCECEYSHQCKRMKQTKNIEKKNNNTFRNEHASFGFICFGCRLISLIKIILYQNYHFQNQYTYAIHAENKILA